MQDIQATPLTRPSSSRTHPVSGRWIFLAAAALTLLLLGILPPLLSVNRYQHRIATSISTSLGRPVHFDRVSLNLLPVPSFLITNLVVEEAPAFGTEPIIHASTVRATLRFRSLWRRRIEFSRISFTDPSINLVHDRNGKWNIEGILLQAAQIETAPTAQRGPGNKPRFPYIEVSGARLNLKQGAEKTPFSLTEADFALWLPDPKAWRMRLRGRPVRTDTGASDTGSLQLEATLGRAPSLESVPLQMDATWRGAPLGEATRLIFARDLGLRGELTISADIQGELNRNTLRTRLEISRFRRADFVPDQPLSLDLECHARSTRVFHQLDDLRCNWPVPDSSGAALALAGSIPDVLNPDYADIQIGTSRLPAPVILDWLRVVSARIPPKLTATGLLSGSVSHEPGSGSLWAGQANLPELQLSGAELGTVPLVLEDLSLSSVDPAPDPHRPHPSTRFVLDQLELPLGGKDPALLEGSVDSGGYNLHLSGTVVLSRLIALGASVPQFGDGLEAALPTNRPPGPVHVDMSAHRDWNGDQVWTDRLAHPGPPPPRPARPTPGRKPR